MTLLAYPLSIFHSFFCNGHGFSVSIPACCFTPLYNIHTKSKNFSSILRTVESILPSLWIKRRGWDKSLTLNIKSEQNYFSDTQNSVLFAFLSNLSILRVDSKDFLTSKSFCPSYSQTHLHVPQFDTIVLNLINGESSI